MLKKFFGWLFGMDEVEYIREKQQAFASTEWCRPHPYERLIFCNNCMVTNCPTNIFCKWCNKILPDFEDMCKASWTDEEEARWGYSERYGWMYDGQPWNGKHCCK